MALIFPESIIDEKKNRLDVDDIIFLEMLEQSLSDEWEFYAWVRRREIQMLFVVNPEFGVFGLHVLFLREHVYQVLTKKDPNIKKQLNEFFEHQKLIIEGMEEDLADILSKVFPNGKPRCSINGGVIIILQSKHTTVQKTEMIKTFINRSIIIDTINNGEILPDIENKLISLTKDDFEELSTDDINSITSLFLKHFELLSSQMEILDQENGMPAWWSTLDDVWQENLLSSAHITEETPKHAILKSILDINFLTIIGKEYTDIEPIRHLKNLEILIILSTDIRDLSPLSNLSNVKHISISGSPIRDLEPLRGFRSLEKIRVGDLGIQDIISFREKYPLIK
jgi:Leucine-rich repeat (LRR) protein